MLYCSYNAQATLHLQPALWSLMLPVTVHGRVSDIWRGYVTQRLLRLIDLRVVFAPSLVIQVSQSSLSLLHLCFLNIESYFILYYFILFYIILYYFIFQTRNVHDYIADFDSEIHLYLRSNRLLEQLNEWNPTPAALGSSEPLCACIEEIWIMLYESGYIEIGDVHLVQSWLHSLLTVGYKFPKILNKEVGGGGGGAGGGGGEVVVDKESTPPSTVENVVTKSNSTEIKSSKDDLKI